VSVVSPNGFAGERPPVADRRAMERTMVDIHRLLAEQDFADIDEANRFLAKLMAGGGVPAGQAAINLSGGPSNSGSLK
jgi:hypothetical protein